MTGAEEESLENDGVIIVCEAGHSGGDGEGGGDIGCVNHFQVLT